MVVVPPNTYTGPIDNSINGTAQGNALVDANKAQAAALGITLPGGTSKITDPIAASTVRRYTGTNGNPLDTATAAASQPGGIYNTAQPNEAQIRADAQTRVQAQVDAIKNTYAGILARTAQDNLGRSGQTRATAARSGLLGSDFGNAELDKTTQQNNEILAAQEAERDAKISTLLGAADDRATSLIENEKNRAMKSSEDYLAHLKQTSDQARTDVKAMAASGLSLDQLDQNQYNQLVEQTGLTDAQLHAEFVLNKPQDKILTSFTQGSKYYVVSQDSTGKRKTETVDLGFSVPADYSTTKLDDGSLVFYPKSFDPSKPVKDQILTYGAPSSSYKLDQEKKAADLTHTQLENKALLDKSGADSTTKTDLQDAADAIAAGADSDKVRQRFLDAHPTAGNLFLQYTKQAY